MAKYTAAPWRTLDGSGTLIRAGDREIGVAFARDVTADEQIGNAYVMEQSPAMADLLRDLLPMVEDWADGGDDEGAAEMAERIQAILGRIDGR